MTLWPGQSDTEISFVYFSGFEVFSMKLIIIPRGARPKASRRGVYESSAWALRVYEKSSAWAARGLSGMQIWMAHIFLYTIASLRTKKPRSGENIALPSEEEAVNKRQMRGYSDHRHGQTAVIAVFFRCLCIQFNPFLMQSDKIPQLQCERSRWTEGGGPNCRRLEAKRSGEAVHSWKFAVKLQLNMFLDATMGSKNYTIWKIHVSDIFPG